jgi:ubiquinone/menaquinone biosynthesis C-methylase UbiE
MAATERIPATKKRVILNDTAEFYNSAYDRLGFAAQRTYPNEELLRFFGTYYFSLSPEQRARLRVLEVGCGSGANLWMIAREGFEAHGIDLSPQALELCKVMLKKWQTSATLKQGDMTSLPYDDAYLHALVDVFSSYCMPDKDFHRFLDEAARVLAPGGRFFSYTPSKNSDSFREPGPSRFIDANTLDGIRRETAAYYGQYYPFHFIAPDEFSTLLEDRGFKILRNEIVSRSYRDRHEYFEFVIVHAAKI